MPVPPDYSAEISPSADIPVKKRRGFGHAWAWVTFVGVGLQVLVGLATDNLDPVGIMGQNLFGAGLGAWVERQNRENTED